MMTFNNASLQKLFEAIKKLKVVVLGDIMLDHYIWGDASRISPEAPVPVVTIDRHSYVAGGAANVALNLAAIGAQVDLCGILGRDESGKRLEELLSSHKIYLDPAFCLKDCPTITKSRVVVRNQQLCRLDQENIPSCYQIVDAQIASIEEKIRNASALIYSDYAKGTITAELVAHFTHYAHKHNVFVAMDPKPRRSMHFKDVDLLTPNLKESLELAGITLEPFEEFPEAEVCRIIKERFNPSCLVITMGAKGMLLCSDNEPVMTIPTSAREVYDVSGAGDTVIASLTAALALKINLPDAAHFANTAAGVVVGKFGTATASPEEILNHIEKFKKT